MSHWVRDSLFSFLFSRAKWGEEGVIQNHCNWWQNNFRCFQRLNTKGNNTWGLLVLFIFLENVFKGRANGVSERMSADLPVLCSRVNSSQSENVSRRKNQHFCIYYAWVMRHFGDGSVWLSITLYGWHISQNNTRTNRITTKSFCASE